MFLARTLVFAAFSAILAIAPSAYCEELTRLRPLGEIQGTFNTTPRGTYLSRAQVRVKNVGSVEATGIRIEAILPDGNRLQLYGPSSLDKYEKATFERSDYVPYPPGGRLKVEITCDNCRK